MKNFLVACLIAFICCGWTNAQNKIHRCKVSLADFNTDKGSTLGNFTTEVLSEKLITKSYKFPKTDLFVTTSVLYMQVSPYKEGSPPAEIVLTLVLGSKAYSVIENEMKESDVVSIARAVVPLKAFEEAKVETIYLGQRQPIIISLKCGK